MADRLNIIEQLRLAHDLRQYVTITLSTGEPLLTDVREVNADGGEGYVVVGATETFGGDDRERTIALYEVIAVVIETDMHVDGPG